tara:strand:- start:1128 stop:1256 length:129 start_codon:yes stop_codon:yes gene_type:complete
MLNKYDVYDKLATTGGLIGRALVFVGMICGCILIWYFIFKAV